jgi:hypothetical protein
MEKDIDINKRKARTPRFLEDRERTARVMLRVIAVLACLAAVLGVLCLAVTVRYKYVTVEVGERLTAADMMGRNGEGAYFGADFDSDFFDRVGIWYFDVIKGQKTVRVRLRVVDQTAPQVTVRDIACAVGGNYPVPEDFIASAYEPNGLVGEFVTPLPEIDSMGSYETQVRYRDASGNKTGVFDVRFSIVVDARPPEVEVTRETEISVGEELVLDVRLTDNCIGELTYTTDTSLLDSSRAGKYPVYVRATDAMGNVSEPVEVIVRVVAGE